MENKIFVNADIFEIYLEQFRIPREYEGMAKEYIPDITDVYR